MERLIGTIRREYLDQTFFWNATDLDRKLEEFRDYNNAARVHRARRRRTRQTRRRTLPRSRCAGSVRLAAALPVPVSEPDRA